MIFYGLHANDTKIAVASGGIVIEQKDADIEMVSEKLEISPKNITVKYTFFNHGNTKKIKVGFPLPRSPYLMENNGGHPYAKWDEAQLALRTLYGDDNTKGFQGLEQQLKESEIIDFTVFVNGKSIRFECHRRALDQKGNDITTKLKNYRIPLSSAYLRGFIEKPPMLLLPGLKETLRHLNLLDKNELPNWFLHTTYAWEQEYLGKQTTIVEHSYTPSTGLYWIDLSAFNDLKNLKEHSDLDRHPPLNLEKSTVDKDHFKKFMKNWALQYKDKISKLKLLREIQYVLKTGANWKGPIANFELVITPENANDLVIIEGEHPMRRHKKKGICTVRFRNFHPKENLRIWIIPAVEGPEEE